MKIEWHCLWIAIGGALGALGRYGIGRSMSRFFEHPFPVGTLFANVSGCLFIGVMLGSGIFDKSTPARMGIGVGFLGALTTFSTFGAETIQHLEQQQWGWAIVNVIANLVLGLTAVSIGLLIGRRLAPWI